MNNPIGTSKSLCNRFGFPGIRKRRLARLLAGAGLALSLAAAQADTPVLKVRFGFDDAGPGFATPSDTSSGGADVTLYTFTNSGVLADFHGKPDSGVAGSITHSRALDFSYTANQGGAGALASATNANLGFGDVSAFTATIWFKSDSLLSGNIGPRLFILAAGSATDSGVANTLGLKFQTASQLSAQINATVTANASFASNLPTNTWLFVAVTYDGSNVKIYEGSDTSAATLISTTAAAGQVVSLGNSGALYLGNRRARDRNFGGWIDSFRFYTGAGDAAFVENLRSTEAGSPPTVSNVFPDGTALQQGTTTLSFSASSPNSYSITNIQLILNSNDVSSGLVITGPAANRSVTYPKLQWNQIYSAFIKAQDANGSVGTFSVNFDTFAGTNFTFEAEDYDFGGGQFIDNPVYTSTAQANSYFGQLGQEGIDEHQSTIDGTSTYRVGDTTATVNIVGELTRQNILNAQALDSGVVDHVIGYWESGEWANYTRTFPAGKYNVYGRFSAGAAASATLSQVTGGRGTANQTTAAVGTFSATGNNYNSYLWVPCRDGVGNLAVLNFDGGAQALRVTSGSGFNANFFMLVPVNTTLPTIANVYPDGLKLFEPTNKFVFTANSTVGITPSGIQLTLSGTNPAVQFSSNVTAQLVLTGSSASWNASFAGLLSNTVYSAVITVTDINGNVASSTITFDTYAPSFVWEAEEFDFNGGQYIDNPVYTAASQANSYYGVSGQGGIDEGGANGTGVNSTCYRPGDQVATPVTTDVTRQRFIDAGLSDHIVGNTVAGEWLNFTKSYPAGTYNVYVRASVSGTANLILDQILAGRGTSTQGGTQLGTFNFTGSGWPIFQYVPLRDAFGNIANVTFTGAPTTLRVNISAIANINFFMLVPARTDLARVDHIYPDGTMHLQGTNQFTFSASSSAGINPANIQLTLNGANVSSSLALSGSSTSWNASFPGLTANTNYTAVLSVTDTNGKAATATIYFDTFDAGNFTWQAEDYDFGSGQFIDNPLPTSSSAANSYFGQSGTDYVDYDYATTVTGELFPYRSQDNYIGTQVSGDSPLPNYVAAQRNNDMTVQNYNVAWWQTNAWMNYTRTFPTGNYYIYARLAGTTAGRAYTNRLDKVIAGWGTDSQTLQPLGEFHNIGAGAQIWQWTPLTTNSLRTVVSLSGRTTLRVTTFGNDNADFFMLVPAPAAAVSLNILPNGSSMLLSFPTQTGYSYQVQYKNALSDTVWTPLGSSVSGDGTVKSASDSLGAGHTQRFYRLSIH